MERCSICDNLAGNKFLSAAQFLSKEGKDVRRMKKADFMDFAERYADYVVLYEKQNSHNP